nr:hypothetical protein [Tanacetum cinerariifolium]
KAASTIVDIRHGEVATTVTGLEIGHSSDDLEDSSKHGRKIAAIDQDLAISLVQHDVQTQGRYGHDMKYDTSVFDSTTIGAEISTTSPKVKTASVFVDDTVAETLVYIRRSEAKAKDKGKCIMEESESPMIMTKRTKRQQKQERLGLEAAVKLQEELDKEERQRITKVHKAARSFTEEEWEDIRARVEANEELVQRLQTEEREKYNKDK